MRGKPKTPPDMANRKVSQKRQNDKEQLPPPPSQTNTTILDALPAPIVLVDVKGSIMSVNKAWRTFTTITPFKRTQLDIGRNYIQMFKQAYRGNLREIRCLSKGLHAVLAGKKTSFSIEHPCPSPKEQRWFRILITPLSENGAGAGIIMHLNVTDRRKVEEAAQKDREKIEGIIKSAMDAIITVDHNQRIVMFNPAAEHMFGFNTEEVMGHSLDQLLPPKFREVHRRYIREYGQTGTTPRAMGKLGRVFGLRGNGDVFPIEASISKNGVGKGKLFTVILRDISARLKSEEDLRNSEERLEFALWGANLGAWDWNIQTGNVQRNECWAEMIGYTSEDLKPNFRTFENLIHPDDKPIVMATLKDHLDGRNPYYQAEFRLRTKSGTWKWILDSGKVVKRDAGVDRFGLRVLIWM